MKIAFDCRYIGRSGIGRVCEGIADALDYDANEYYLIGNRERLEKYKGRAKIVEDDTDPYSVAGLRSFDRSLNQLCDALLIPNFLIPFGVRIPVHTIMHDLAFLDVKETTRGAVDKFIKKTLLKRCMKKSRTVACVSAYTLERCKYYYGRLAEKCYVNYNGISESVFSYARACPHAIKGNYIVFVGNVKPHKRLKTLLSAFGKVGGEMKLKIIGEKDTFLTGLDLDESAYQNVEFTGRLDDKALLPEVQGAKYLVLPSKYEGFGLPPLEALCLGTQPIVSDIEVFREVYAGLPVVFFNDEDELSDKLTLPPEEIDCEAVIEEKYNYDRCVEKLLTHICQG